MKSDQLLINEQIKDAVNAVLNKITAEIEDYVCNHETNTDKAQGMLNALQILDKYGEERGI